MAIKITEECINCGACEPECPNNAIYEGGVEWALADGTTVKGSFTLMDGSSIVLTRRMRLWQLMFTISYQINAQNARVFMRSHNVLLFAR
jgi:ferredoxin